MKQLKIENIGHEDLAIRKILLIFVADFLLFIMAKLYRHYKGRIVTETSEACALRLARVWYCQSIAAMD